VVPGGSAHRYRRDVRALEVQPVGIVRSTRAVALDDGWDGETSAIELLTPFDERALRGLETFSHALIVFVFDRAMWDVSKMSRHPRGNEAWPEVGIFAQRAKDRPNRIGVTTCRILGIDGSIVRVGGLDAIDGTPVLDIKPHMTAFGPRGEVHEPAWASELMADYW
jgi:tRNA-Thr(GGU) m(6)t(6)A37 methyltransferase TsaA